MKENTFTPQQIAGILKDVDGSGSGFVSTRAQAWGKANEIEFASIQPGKPTQNAPALNGSI